MARKYTLEFKKEAAKLVIEQGYSRKKAAELLGVSPKNVNRWVDEFNGKEKSVKKEILEQELIRKLQKENELLKMEREILKKAAAFFAKENH